MKKKFLLALMVVVLSIIAFGTISASAEKEGVYTYSISNQQVTITDCNESASGAIVIPSTLGGYPVTKIGNEAFYNCSGLINITIPNSVTTIGYYAFEGCSNLTNITIPDSVTKIGFRAFYECSSLVSITIPNKVAIIYYSTFYNCSSLTNITIPNSVTEIGDSAFYNCSSLASITIPNSVTKIGNEAFYNCSSLINITIPNSVTTIGYYAFEGCSNLTNITIPDSVTNIGFRAFYECGSLVSITIPDKVTAIYYSTFYNCSSLTNITIPNSVTEIGDSAFGNCDNLKDVYYNGTEAEWNNISIGSSNNELTNATRKYFLYVTFCDKYGTEISKTMQGFNTLVDTREVVIPDGCKMVLYIDKEQTITYDINTPISKNLTLYVDYKIEFEGTKTEVSEDKKSFTVTPINIEPGKAVILALYNGNKFVEIQSAVCTGEAIPFTTDKTYTVAKVMVWDNLTTLKPVCEGEIIK